MLVKSERGFKRKTIEKNIKSEMEKWIKTLPKDLQIEVRDALVVTGGCITSMLLGELPNDYDVYFSNIDTAKKVVDHYLSDYDIKNERASLESIIENEGIRVVVKSAGIIGSASDDLKNYQYFEYQPHERVEQFMEKYDEYKHGSPYSVSFITSNAISLFPNIQIITRFVGNPNEIHENYDFVHTTNYFTFKDGVVLNHAALEATLAKELKYVGSRFPICSMFRLKKFLRRGWTITAGEMLKIAWDINKLDLNSIETLTDQLVGVDAAYFHEIISSLTTAQNGGSMETIDRTYLFELINRVFDETESNE